MRRSPPRRIFTVAVRCTRSWATAVYRCRHLRHRLLSDDEPGDDVGAAGDETVRAWRQRFQLRHSVAYRGVPGGAVGPHGFDVCSVRRAAGEIAGGLRISRSEYLIGYPLQGLSQALEVSCRRENAWMNSSPWSRPAITPAPSSAITPKIPACRRTLARRASAATCWSSTSAASLRA